MNIKGYVYFTIEKNSDGVELFHNGDKKIGIGKTNDNSRRFKEHATRGSKATVGIEFLDTVDCDEIGMQDSVLEIKLHDILENLGFLHIYRTSIFEKENEKIVSPTEVFSGKSKRTIEGVVSKNEQLSVDLIKRIIRNISNVDLFKKNLALLPHQIKSYQFVLDRFNSGVKDVLLNHKPRSGKSFICYHYMIQQVPQNVLLFSQYPILNGQWKSEFENLRGHDYNIIISRDVNKIVLDKTRPNFIMISLQDAKGEDGDNKIVEGLKKQKFSELLGTTWDLVIFDECHKSRETYKTDKLLEGLKYNHLIGLSATPTKNLLRGTFTIDNVDRYTLTEESEYKRLYPEQYKNPTINHYLFNIDEDVKKELEYFKVEEGFTFNKFFEVKDGRLVYHNDIVKLFSWYFCKGRYNRKENATFNVVNKCQSILLFASSNECQSLIAEILTDIVGDVYDVYYTNSEINSSSQLLEKIKNDFVPREGKKVIIVANRQLTTGITLKYCDMVVFMNDWKSLDEYIQASYRCQTENFGKDECYAVDLNPGRAYNILYSYIETNSSFKKYDINDAIREYLNSAPIFENFANELKQIDFEEFKNRVVNYSGVENKFFPKTILNSDDEILKEQDRLLSLGELDSGVKLTSERVKLDETQPDGGKTSSRVEKEKQIRETDEYKDTLEICINNAEFLLERVPILSLSTEFSCDNIDSIFELLDGNEEMREQFLNDLLIDKILKEK